MYLMYTSSNILVLNDDHELLLTFHLQVSLWVAINVAKTLQILLQKENERGFNISSKATDGHVYKAIKVTP